MFVNIVGKTCELRQWHRHTYSGFLGLEKISSKVFKGGIEFTGLNVIMGENCMI